MGVHPPKVTKFSPNTKSVETLGDLIEIANDFEKYVSSRSSRQLNRQFNKNNSMGDNDDDVFRKTVKRRRIVPERLSANEDKDNERYFKILKIREPMEELNRLVGLDDFKKSIVRQILFLSMGLKESESTFLNSALMGPPGTGKTTIGRILANVYRKLGILSTGHFTVANRNDFIGKYTGHTALKTEKFLKRCLGGVLFIDEAYSLGPQSGDTDSYGKEALDILNQFLSEHADDFVCIIAGYEKNLEDSFFAMNPGLHRRFPWRYKIDNYKPMEMYEIFKGKIELSESNWKLSRKIDPVDVQTLFERYRSSLPFGGGDCLNLLNLVKIYYSKRTFVVPKRTKAHIIDIEDVRSAFKEYSERMANKNKLEDSLLNSLYS